MHADIREYEKLYFSSCEECSACCDGSAFKFIPLILDDFSDCYRFFPVVFGYVDGSLRALMLIDSDNSGCPYLKEGACTIYKERPPGCRIYPLTPFHGAVYVDRACKAVGESGTPMVENGEAKELFLHPRFKDFPAKLSRTEKFLEGIEPTLLPIGSLHGINLFASPHEDDAGFLEMHRASLRLL